MYALARDAPDALKHDESYNALVMNPRMNRSFRNSPWHAVYAGGNLKYVSTGIRREDLPDLMPDTIWALCKRRTHHPPSVQSTRRVWRHFSISGSLQKSPGRSKTVVGEPHQSLESSMAVANGSKPNGPPLDF